MKNLIKQFNTFEEGIQEVRKLLPQSIKYVGEDITNERDVVNNIVKVVLGNYPSPMNPDYPGVPAFSISAKETGYKSAGFYSLGWKYVKSGDSYIFSFRITFLSKKNSPLPDKLIEAGWTELKK